MRGFIGLGLSVVLGFVVIAASPRGAESAYSPFGYRGKVTLQNRRTSVTRVKLTGTGVNCVIDLAPGTKFVYSGLAQYTGYSWCSDYDVNGTYDGQLDFTLAKSYLGYAYDL